MKSIYVSPPSPALGAYEVQWQEEITPSRENLWKDQTGWWSDNYVSWPSAGPDLSLSKPQEDERLESGKEVLVSDAYR